MPPKIKVKSVTNLIYENKEELIKKINDKSIFKEKYKKQPFLFYIAKAGIPSDEKIALYEIMKKNNCDFNETDDSGNNIFSCIYDKKSLVYFIENGVSINIVNYHGKPMTSFLNKRDFYILNEMKKTPDYLLNDPRGVNFLFKKGCELYFEFIDLIEDKNFRNSFGENVAFFIPSDKELIRRLINEKVDFNCKNEKDETILFNASAKKIELLKEFNIIVDLQTEEFSNPIKKEVESLFHFLNQNNVYFGNDNFKMNICNSAQRIMVLIDYGLWSNQIENYYSIILSIKERQVSLLNSRTNKKDEKSFYINNLIEKIKDKFEKSELILRSNKKRL